MSLFDRDNSNSKEFKKRIAEHQYDYYELYSPELLEWIGRTTDPVLLSCASHLINTWDWPTYLPKPAKEYDMVSHGHYGDKKDYKSILFTQKLMEQLDAKAEAISPGLPQTLWMTKYFKKYSSKPLTP